MRPQFFHIRFGVFASHNSLLCFLSHSVLLIREGALLTLCYNLAMDEDDDLNACRADQNHAEAFHHHGTSGGWPKASSGSRKSFCLMADQAQKIALHTTSALPPTTKTSPRITIAVSYFCRPSFLLRWGLLYPVAIPPASWSSPQRHRP